ncbi:unnamed protein product [Rotaria sordida]|uniref:Kinesin light chain n=1 Tax=Rotaria sordida TaxID=392033 RepID=A0A815D9B7_9BILA|nr:unnamed protein product [Rotaria sordida]CAF1569184.1 unnamed protein product [Rotaria sordida]CAF3810690.1 unnamed protein product [Rotaria sordida]
MHSVFRIREIKPINKDNRLWQVDLSLTSDTDPELQTLTECLRNETFPTESGWYRLGALLITMGQFDNAYQVYEMLLKQTHDDWEKANIYHQLGRVQDYKGEYAESIRFNEKALEIKQKTLPPDDYNLAVTYNNIGLVYEKMSEYSKALSFGEKALEIKQKILPPNHPALANSYNNIGLVYDKMGEYSKALSFQEKALAIKQKCFPPNHPELAITYNNLSRVYTNMADYSKALLFCERALHIGQSSLPPNHPDLQKYQKDIESLRKKI